MLRALVEMIWVTHFLLFPPPSAVRPTAQRRRGEGSISGLLVSPPSYMGAGGFRNHQKNWKFVALFTEQNSCPCMNFSYPERRGTRFFHDSIRDPMMVLFFPSSFGTQTDLTAATWIHHPHPRSPATKCNRGRGIKEGDKSAKKSVLDSGRKKTEEAANIHAPICFLQK